MSAAPVSSRAIPGPARAVEFSLARACILQDVCYDVDALLESRAERVAAWPLAAIACGLRVRVPHLVVSADRALVARRAIAAASGGSAIGLEKGDRLFRAVAWLRELLLIPLMRRVDP